MCFTSLSTTNGCARATIRRRSTSAPGRMAMTTDGYVVSPLFFPGGDIGKLAVCGTINDLAMAGARPLYLTASFIIEEGFALADLKRIAELMGAASKAAGVPVVAGDTKVVERGKADGVFISTAGVGAIPGARSLLPARAGGRCRAAFGEHRRPRRRGDVEAGEFGVRDRDRVRLRGAAWAGRRYGRGGRAAFARHARSHARRARGGAQRIRQCRAGGLLGRGGGDSGRAEVAAACEFLGSIRSTSPTRASSSRSSRRRGRRRCSPRCARIRWRATRR